MMPTRKAPARSTAPAQRTTQSTPPRIAVALAGGGPLGAIYEIGALCALDDCLNGLNFNACDHYVGVSAGGFIVAGLANGMTPRQLCEAFIEDLPNEENFDPSWLLKPAWAEFGERLQRLPGLLGSALWAWGVQGKPLTNAFERLGAALPTGLLDNEGIHQHIERLFSREGRSNDFRQLRARLTLVATQLDTGNAAPFGSPGWDHVPISRAIQASAALPGLFPPVEIEGKHYVDGALKKTLHATMALDEGVGLLLCLNPLVPFHASEHPSHAKRIPSLIQGGLPAVMSQTFRSMIHSRLALGLKHYERAYPGTDIVLIEPDHRDAELFFANTFSYRQRREMAEHAYQQTRQQLLERQTELAPKLARHGVQIDTAALTDPHKHLLSPTHQQVKASRVGTPTTRRLHETLDNLQNQLVLTASPTRPSPHC
ncbi:MAG: patatin-like phospholipase family protein [Hydrogenophaga sp.]|uniref:patatin-like phospholipase family protein n=1 Tax=Hydrogenophaga sp. TaxID=1904254 RepID=UPI00276A073B|nr:patatin-like phospholipase family protein [Hydrogenophaga sp.]MDP2417268.1 patatin-like phospholipase family protein [Hydrogenophaga sp.]MDZ4189071.1 patatin-like phospholipase family protein [Hydrogenophaga sp.]